MIPAAFDYVRADSVDAAIAALAEHGDDAKLLAGGMSLLPLMKLRLRDADGARRRRSARATSRYVRDAGDHVAIGALTRHRDLETSDVLARAVRRAARASPREVGDNQVRHRGTIGGSVAHGDPASDLPAVLLALDATFVAQGPGGERTIAGDRLLPGLPRDRARARRAAHRDPGAEGRPAAGSRSRSSTAARRTGRSSARSPCDNGATRASRS